MFSCLRRVIDPLTVLMYSDSLSEALKLVEGTHAPEDPNNAFKDASGFHDSQQGQFKLAAVSSAVYLSFSSSRHVNTEQTAIYRKS